MSLAVSPASTAPVFNPEHLAQGHLDRGIMLTKEPICDYRGAMREYNAGINLYPSNSLLMKLYRYKAWVLIRLNDFSRAEHYGRMALKLVDPPPNFYNEKIYLDLSCALDKQRKFEEAKALLIERSKLPILDIEIQALMIKNLAIIQIKMGEHREAIDNMRKALAMDPLEPDIKGRLYLNLANALSRAKENQVDQPGEIELSEENILDLVNKGLSQAGISDEERASFYILQGNEYKDRGNQKAAEEAFANGLKFAPIHSNIRPSCWNEKNLKDV